MLNRFRLWLRTLLFRGRLEREIQEEMAAHLARSTERFLAQGMTAEEARRAARREFGHLDSIQEAARDARGARGLESVVADVRSAIRYFGRKPVSTTTMVLVLALGIGFNTVLFVFMYSFVNGPPPGMALQESLVRIRGIGRATWPGRIIGREFSYPEYREYASQTRLFSAVAAWTSSDVVFDYGGQEENLHSGAATYVTASYFPVLGVRPIIGAGLPADERTTTSGLVVAQIALTQPALLGMGALMLEMTADFRERPSSVVADRILEVRFNTNPRYGSMDRNREETLRRLQTQLAALPGVVAVVPQENADDYFDVVVHPADRVDGAELGPTLHLRAHAAPPGYFSLMAAPIVLGRDFHAADSQEHGAVVIGADLARRLWGPADPIGRRFISASPNQRHAGLFTVVGVVDGAKAGLGESGDEVQRIFVADARITGHFLIRMQGPAQPAIPMIRSAANAEAPDLPLTGVRTLAAIEASERSTTVQVITATGGIGILALFLSAIGLYAVVTFAVGRRVREIGICTALGAGRPEVVRLFLFRGLRLSVVGLFLGLTLSLIGVRLMAVMRGQDPPAETVWLAAPVAALVIGVALLASWIPARRAARIDPLQALRTE